MGQAIKSLTGRRARPPLFRGIECQVWPTKGALVVPLQRESRAPSCTAIGCESLPVCGPFLGISAGLDARMATASGTVEGRPRPRRARNGNALDLRPSPQPTLRRSCLGRLLFWPPRRYWRRRDLRSRKPAGKRRPSTGVDVEVVTLLAFFEEIPAELGDVRTRRHAFGTDAFFAIAGREIEVPLEIAFHPLVLGA
jgi:hypothetical protein